VICNVVVERRYRRRGIARRLVTATISEARRQGADGVVLQVFQDNRPALHLYTDLGFERVAGETELRADTVRLVAMKDAPGYHLRLWRPADGRAAFELAQRAIPAPQQWLRPVRPAEYQPDWLSRVSRAVNDALAGRRTYRLLASPEAGGELAALLTLEVAFGRGEHRLSLLVDPAHRGRVEAALLGRALHLVAAGSPRPVRAQVNADHDAALQVLGETGFRERRTLLTLSHVVKQEREMTYGRLV